MYKQRSISIKCPDCDGADYNSHNEIYDKEWVTLLCICNLCNTEFQINYRAVGIDKTMKVSK